SSSTPVGLVITPTFRPEKTRHWSAAATSAPVLRPRPRPPPLLPRPPSARATPAVSAEPATAAAPIPAPRNIPRLLTVIQPSLSVCDGQDRRTALLIRRTASSSFVPRASPTSATSPTYTAEGSPTPAARSPPSRGA